MVLVTDFARGVSVLRPLPLPPSPCARWVRVWTSLTASLLLSLVWLGSFTWLFLRYCALGMAIWIFANFITWILSEHLHCPKVIQVSAV